MPIQFRCTNCNQLLSISRKKAGVEILCPKCTTLTRVPQIAEAEDEPEAPRPAPPKAAPPKAAPAARAEVAESRPSPPPPPVAPALPPVELRRPPVEEWPASSPAEDQEFEEESLPPDVEDDAQTFLHEAHGGLADPVPPLPYNSWTDIEHDEDDFHPMKRQHPPKDELDMTSLVDVTFLLLVFFMITASFTVQKFLQIAAPESDDNAAAATAVVQNDDIVGESVVVAVDAEDRIQVDDAPVGSLAELKDLLGRKLRDDGKSDVLIEAAYKAPHGTVVAVTDMAIQAGMRHVRRASRRDADE